MANKKMDAALSQLPAAARERVEAALQRTLEAELSREGVLDASPAAFSRSKGPIFSKSKTANALRETLESPGDQAILRDVSKMADEDFRKFAERISTLRRIKGESERQVE